MLLFFLYFILYLSNSTSLSLSNSLQIIHDFPKWWAFLTSDGFKSHSNVTEGLKTFAEERIRVGKEEAGKNSFNQAYDKWQLNRDKAQIRQIL